MCQLQSSLLFGITADGTGLWLRLRFSDESEQSPSVKTELFIVDKDGEHVTIGLGYLRSESRQEGFYQAGYLKPLLRANRALDLSNDSTERQQIAAVVLVRFWGVPLGLSHSSGMRPESGVWDAGKLIAHFGPSFRWRKLLPRWMPVLMTGIMAEGGSFYKHGREPTPGRTTRSEEEETKKTPLQRNLLYGNIAAQSFNYTDADETDGEPTESSGNEDFSDDAEAGSGSGKCPKRSASSQTRTKRRKVAGFGRIENRECFCSVLAEGLD